MNHSKLTEILPKEIQVNGVIYHLLIYTDHSKASIRIKYQNHGELFLFNREYNIFGVSFNDLINVILEDVKNEIDVLDQKILNEITNDSISTLEQKLRDLIKQHYNKEDVITEALVRCCIKTLELYNEELDKIVKSVKNRNDFK